jgi:thiol-disulfide isomerase/thioredoxin
VEVVYEEYYEKIWKIKGPRRYWIDKDTGFLRRVEFSEVSGAGLRKWTVTVHKISERKSTPVAATATAARSRSKLIGREAPGFNLRTSGGTAVELSALRGRVVVLIFWATWCGPCVEEIPFLEKMQSELGGSDTLLLGVNDESETVVRAWMKEYGRSFETTVDGKTAVQAYGVEARPDIVVVGKDGTVVDELVGWRKESQFREWIKKYSKRR